MPPPCVYCSNPRACKCIPYCSAHSASYGGCVCKDFGKVDNGGCPQPPDKPVASEDFGKVDKPTPGDSGDETEPCEMRPPTPDRSESSSKMEAYIEKELVSTVVHLRETVEETGRELEEMKAELKSRDNEVYQLRKVKMLQEDAVNHVTGYVDKIKDRMETQDKYISELEKNQMNGERKQLYEELGEAYKKTDSLKTAEIKKLQAKVAKLEKMPRAPKPKVFKPIEPKKVRKKKTKPLSARLKELSKAKTKP